jgi:hypothetical protein
MGLNMHFYSFLFEYMYTNVHIHVYIYLYICIFIYICVHVDDFDDYLHFCSQICCKERGSDVEFNSEVVWHMMYI